MVQVQAISKIIDGIEYTYDPIRDVISRVGGAPIISPFNRTQVEYPVDMCVEISTWCNLSCANCFSNSARGLQGSHLDFNEFSIRLAAEHARLIRVCISGGEPLMHPEIARFLEIPALYPGLGYVINTNGTLHQDQDDLLVNHHWLVAISVHGDRSSHDKYSGFDCFDRTIARVERLAPKTRVHIYSVTHESMTREDVDWLFYLRDAAGALFLRFIMPRQFGRYGSAASNSTLEYIKERLDDRSGMKVDRSKTRFFTVAGVMRESH